MSTVQKNQIPHEDVELMIEQYSRESGYSRNQSKDIFCSNIRGWEAKNREREADNIPFYRMAETTIETRLKKALLEHETWYKDNRQDKEAIPDNNHEEKDNNYFLDEKPQEVAKTE